MVEPLRDQVLLRRLPSEKSTLSGLVLPDIAQKKALRGVVLALGEGIRNRRTGKPFKSEKYEIVIPFQVKVGDIVLFNLFGGREFDAHGHEMTAGDAPGETGVVLIREEEILAVLEES